MKVLFKKGDALDPANYRPIASLPILYKLFTRCLCGRIGTTLDAEQSEDQAGFRKDYSCDDHLFVIRQLSEKANEFCLPLWVAAIDFQKAFDSFSHTALWKALLEQGVPKVYTNALQRLYASQTGTVIAGESSREFAILRESRQGDPISPILFNAVLEMILRPCIEKWKTKKWGWSLSEDSANLLNLRFADDLLLLGRSVFQVQAMLEDVGNAAKQVGLELHYGKTKVIHNGRGQDVRKDQVHANGHAVEIVSSTDYLGTKLSLAHAKSMPVELDHRLARAWAKFAVFRSELTNKKSNLFNRLRLFDSVVTPCALYGSSSWSLRRVDEQKLRVAQRRMLRAIVGKGRRTLEQASASSAEDGSQTEEDAAESDEHLESWIDWMQRTTEEVRTAMQKLKIDDWVTVVRKNQWRWAGRVVQHTTERWTSRVLYWLPQEGSRAVGHPRCRWTDPIQNFAKEWTGMADDCDAWLYLLANKKEATAALPEYINYCSTVAA